MDTNIEPRKQSLEDLFLWPDGTWCSREDFRELDYSHMSDDYLVLWFDTPEWVELMASELD